RFLLRKNARAMRELDALPRRRDRARLLSSVGDLAQLAARHPELARHLGEAPLARARELVAQFRAGFDDGSAAAAALGHRDRAYWALQAAVVELRAAGRYLFRDDRAARAEFGSPYTAKKVREHRKRRREAPGRP